MNLHDLISGGLGAAIGSFLTHALHIKANQLKIKAKLPEPIQKDAEKVLEAGANALEQAAEKAAPVLAEKAADAVVSKL